MDSNHTCLVVIKLESVFKKDDNDYPQVFLKECKYIEKKSNYIYQWQLEWFFSSSDKSDEE